MLYKATLITTPCYKKLTTSISVGFLLLSIDNLISFHESLEGMLIRILEITLPSIYIGSLFAFTLTIIFIMIIIPYINVVYKKNSLLIYTIIALLVLVAFSEFIYKLIGNPHPMAYRIEILFEEGSEILASFLFLKFQLQSFNFKQHLTTTPY